MTERGSTVRIAAVADIHVREGDSNEWRELVMAMSRDADILVLSGDLTNRGLAREAEVVVEGLSLCRIPIIAILGNHDVESGEQQEVTRILCDGGVIMLDEEPHEIGGIGFAGVKGFCGGFDRHALSPFGEEMIKQFVRESLDDALRLESGLARLRTEYKIAVLHYAPVRGTVEGEPEEIYPFLGSSRLSDPLDQFGVSAALHGHAHNGAAEGRTIGGVPVYNVALPLMRRLDPDRPYRILEFG